MASSLIPFAGIIARELLGRADAERSDDQHLRYGGISVNLSTATYYDSETDDGGDFLALVSKVRGLDEDSAGAWISEIVSKELAQQTNGYLDAELPLDDISRSRDVVAERGIIGAILLKPAIFDIVYEDLLADDFAEHLHRELYLTIGDLQLRGERPTISAIATALGTNGDQVLPGFTLPQYLARLAADAPMELINDPPKAREVASLLRTLHDERMRSIDEYEREIDREQAATKARFKLRSFNDVVMPDDTYASLVRGILPSSGLGVVWGPPKCGKSFWTFDICMHVALGWPYRGRKVQQGSVVYLVLEGEIGYPKRVEAFRQRFLVGHHHAIPFFDIVTRLDLIREHAQLIKDIKAQLGDMKPAIVCIDTLNRSLVGSETKDEHMGAYIKAADVIREVFGCLVIIVHHCGVEGERPRGHSSLTGAADAQLKVTRDEQKNVVVDVEYLKDGEDGAKIISRLEGVIVGKEPDGYPRTSCVVVDEQGHGAAVGYRAAMDEVKLLRAVIAASDSHGVSPSTVTGLQLPASISKVVEVKYVRELFYKQVGLDVEEDQAAQEKRSRALLARCGKNLERASVLAFYKPTTTQQFMWWTGKPVQGLTLRQEIVPQKPDPALPLDADDLEM
jgi:AAA domain/DnaB-like helicase N terminal domain